MQTRIAAAWPNLVIMGLYLPFGVSLLLVRFFMCLHVFLLSCIFRRYEVTRYVMRFMSGILGCVVVSRCEEKSSQHAPAPVVSNHVTAFDHLAVNLCVPCFSTQSFFTWSCGSKSINLKQPSAEDRKILNNQEEPVHVLPERLPGGNHRTVYKFDHTLFGGLDRVQPVAIEVRRPLPINLVYHPLSPWSELLWLLFNAVTVFHVTFLSPVVRRDGEASECFAGRVRAAIVAALQANALDDTVEAVLERRKTSRPAVNTARTRSSAKASGVSTSSRRLERLAQQVREVLPDTPTRVIEAELERTNDVDVTIANILEGRAAAPVSTPAAAVAPSSFKTAAGRWGQSADERHMSFAERKQAFLENARRRYLEKIGAEEQRVLA